MDPYNRERGAAQPGPDSARPRPAATCTPATAASPWKPAVKEPSVEVKLTNDGQIVEAGYGHGV